MKILACIRPQKSLQNEEAISPIDAKTKEQSYKIAYESKPGFFSRLFSRNKTDEKTRLTDTRV